MGLEEIPSMQILISSPKRFEIEKFPSQRKEKKPQLSVEKEDAEEEKLREIVETMCYKGLLKGNSSEAQSNYSNYKYNNKVEDRDYTI